MSRDVQTDCQLLLPPPPPQMTTWQGPLPPQHSHQNLARPPPVFIGPNYIVIFNPTPNQNPTQVPAFLPPNFHFVGHPKPQIQAQFDPNVGLYNYGNTNIGVEYEYTAIYDPNFGVPSFVTDQGATAAQIPQPHNPVQHVPELNPLGTTFYYPQPQPIAFIPQPVAEATWNSAEDNSHQAPSDSDGSSSTTASASCVQLNPNAPEYIPLQQHVTQGQGKGNPVFNKSWSQEMDNHDNHDGQTPPPVIYDSMRSSTPIFSPSSTYSYSNDRRSPENRPRHGGNEISYGHRGRGGYILRGNRNWNNYDDDNRGYHYEDQEYTGGYIYRGRGGRGRGRGRGRGARGRGGSYNREEHYEQSQQQHHAEHEERGHSGQQRRTEPFRSSASLPGTPAAVPPPPPAQLPGPFSYASALSTGLSLTPLPSSPAKPIVAVKVDSAESIESADDEHFDPAKTTHIINSSFRKNSGRMTLDRNAVPFTSRNKVGINTKDEQEFPSLDTSARVASVGTQFVQKIGDTKSKDREAVNDLVTIKEEECDSQGPLNSDENNNEGQGKHLTPPAQIIGGDGIGIGDFTSNDNDNQPTGELHTSVSPLDGAKGEPAQIF